MRAISGGTPSLTEALDVRFCVVECEAGLYFCACDWSRSDEEYADWRGGKPWTFNAALDPDVSIVASNVAYALARGSALVKTEGVVAASAHGRSTSSVGMIDTIAASPKSSLKGETRECTGWLDGDEGIGDDGGRVWGQEAGSRRGRGVQDGEERGVLRDEKLMTLLDPTCGSGTNLFTALAAGFGKVVGGDVNPTCLEGEF